MRVWPSKDPQDVADWDINWSQLGTDTITVSTWTVTQGDVAIASDEFTDQATKVWLSGGTVDTTCKLTNHITTAGGRQLDQSALLEIKQR